MSWVPDSCTLPLAGRPRRAAEFDDLLGAARGVRRITPGRVRYEFDPHPSVAGRLADLAVREAACCSFFTFTLTADGELLLLDVAVPPERVGVLDGWVAT